MSTLTVTIIFAVSLVALTVLLSLRIRDLRSGKLATSEIPHYDSSLFVAILIFLKRESIVLIKRFLQHALIFIVKLWILVLHKTRTFIKKYLPMLKSRKHIWEKTGTIIFHNFNEYRAKIRKYKRHIDEKEAEIEKEENPFITEESEVDEKQNLV